MNDVEINLQEIKDKVFAFAKERDWEQFHTPKDLAIGLSVEAAELLEHFRFQSEEEVEAKLGDEASLKDIGHELADVLYFVLLMCDRFGLDAASTLEEKLAISAARYPIDQARGKNLKYTELERKGK